MQNQFAFIAALFMCGGILLALFGGPGGSPRAMSPEDAAQALQFLNDAEDSRKAGNADSAFAFTRAAAELGHPFAGFQIGAFFEAGYGVEASLPDAMDWYRRAVRLGSADASLRLGEMRRDGIGVDADPKKAFDHFQNAANRGSAVGQRFVGEHYQAGEVVEQSDAQAAEWYRKASDQGDNDARLRLGLFFVNGTGVEQDALKGFRLVRSAAIAGDGQAAFHLGELYRDGVGVVSDLKKAFSYFNLGSGLSNKDAQAALKEMQSGMTKEEITAAQQFFFQLLESVSFNEHIDAPTTFSDIAGYRDAWTLDLGEGVTLNALAPNPRGGVWGAGSVYLGGDNAQDGLLFYADELGDLIWRKTFGGVGADGFNDITTTIDGDLFLVGDHHRSGGDNFDKVGWAMMVDPSGAPKWEHIDEAPGDALGNGYNAAGVLGSGALVAAGSTQPGDKVAYVGFTTVFSASGAVLTNDLAPGAPPSQIHGLAVGPEGHAYLAGLADVAPNSNCIDFDGENFCLGEWAGWFGAIDDKGLASPVLPMTAIRGDQQDYNTFLAITVDNSGSAFVAGDVDSGDNEYQALVAAINDDGSVRWQQRIGPIGGGSHGRAIAVSPQGAVVVGGIVDDVSSGAPRGLVAVLSPDGEILFARGLESFGRSTIFYAMTFGVEGALYVGGHTVVAVEGQFSGDTHSILRRLNFIARPPEPEKTAVD